MLACEFFTVDCAVTFRSGRFAPQGAGSLPTSSTSGRATPCRPGRQRAGRSVRRSLVAFAYTQHGLRHHPGFAGPPTLTPLVPILVVLLVIRCLDHRRYRRERRGLRFDDREGI